MISTAAGAATRAPAPEQQIRFCRGRGGVRIAYAIHGTGPPVVVVSCWLSHLQHDWHSPVWRHFLDDLGEVATVIRYDERGFGLSDWKVNDFSLEARLADLEALMSGSISRASRSSGCRAARQSPSRTQHGIRTESAASSCTAAPSAAGPSRPRRIGSGTQPIVASSSWAGLGRSPRFAGSSRPTSCRTRPRSRCAGSTTCSACRPRSRMPSRRGTGGWPSDRARAPVDRCADARPARDRGSRRRVRGCDPGGVPDPELAARADGQPEPHPPGRRARLADFMTEVRAFLAPERRRSEGRLGAPGLERAHATRASTSFALSRTARTTRPSPCPRAEPANRGASPLEHLREARLDGRAARAAAVASLVARRQLTAAGYVPAATSPSLRRSVCVSARFRSRPPLRHRPSRRMSQTGGLPWERASAKRRRDFARTRRRHSPRRP